MLQRDILLRDSKVPLYPQQKNVLSIKYSPFWDVTYCLLVQT